MNKLRCLFTAIVLLVLNVSQSENHRNITSEIIIDVYKFFASNCLYIVHPEGSHMSWNIPKTQTSSTAREVLTGTISTRILRENSLYLNNVCNRPLFVLSNIDDFARQLNNSSIATSLMSTSVWLVFAPENVSLEASFFKVNIPFDCQLLVAQPSQGNIRLVELYRVAQHSALQMYDFGSWGPHAGFKGPGSKYIYHRRSNLQGAVLRTTFSISPFETEANPDENTFVLGGLFGPIWDILERNIHFKSQHISPQVENSGFLYKNGSWSGMMGVLVRNETDVTSSALSVTSGRAKYVSFTMPFITFETRIYIQQPQRSTTVNALLSTFSIELWLALLLTVLITSIVLKYLHSSQPSFEKTQDSLQDIVFLIFGTIFCKQCDSEAPPSIAKRIVLFSANLVGIVVMGVYCGFLISSLTVNRSKLPFSTLEKFYKDGTFSIGMRKDTIAYSTFRNAQSSPRKEIYNKFILPNIADLPRSAKEGFDRVCKKRFIFISNDAALIFQSPNCSIVSLPEYFEKLKMSLAFPKHSPYVRLFNYNIVRMLSSGIVRKINADDVRIRTGGKVHERLHEPKPINFKTITPIFYVWFAGVMLSVLILAVENLIFKLQKCNNKVHTKEVVSSHNYKKNCGIIRKRNFRYKRW